MKDEQTDELRKITEEMNAEWARQVVEGWVTLLRLLDEARADQARLVAELAHAESRDWSKVAPGLVRVHENGYELLHPDADRWTPEQLKAWASTGDLLGLMARAIDARRGDASSYELARAALAAAIEA